MRDLAPTQKWNAKYSRGGDFPDPAEVLSHNRHLLPKRGLALDLASGLGANSLLLAEAGLEAHAWDCSDVALERLEKEAVAHGLSVHTAVRDVESQPPEPGSFDVIVVSLFLHRPSCDALVAALRPSGLLFYQTATRDKLSERGPSSSDHLLLPNELLSLFSPLECRFYREDARTGDLNVGLRNHALFVGQKVGTATG